MPTIDQIKKVQDITSPLIKQRYLKYFQLPPDLQLIMFSGETANKIDIISKKNTLNEEQTWWTSYMAGMIILGETNIIDFVKTLQTKCELEESAARQLARDINQSIFLPVKESLKKIHQITEWPKGEKETIPQTNNPQLNGNIVDLKGK